jgi:hypothetical protein
MFNVSGSKFKSSKLKNGNWQHQPLWSEFALYNVHVHLKGVFVLRKLKLPVGNLGKLE